MRFKLILIFLVFLVSINYVNAACTGTSYSGSGNWNIGNTTVCVDMEIILAQNADINVSGNLTLTNVNLTMNGTSDGGANITVYNGGKLVLNVSSSSELNRITSANTANEYAFDAYNGSYLYIDHANISEVGWTTALDTGGIYIVTKNATITNTNFINNFRSFIIDVSDSNPSAIHMANLTISSSGSNPFYIWDNLNGALFENINAGSTHTRGFTVGGYNNTFINITMTDTTSSVGSSGAALWRRGDGTSNERHSIFINCNFTNGYDEALSTTSGDKFTDVFINSHFATYDRDNNDVTILFTTGTQNRKWNFVNTTFNESDVTVDSYSPLNVSWYLGVTVNSSEGNNVNGAIVETYSSSGSLLSNTTTNSSGVTPLLNITEYLEESTGKTYYTNISINVSYPTSQYDPNTKKINLTSSRTVNVQLTENDALAPSVTSLIPSTGASYSAGDSITLKANISDDTTLGNSTINITRPDGITEQYNLTQDSCHQYIKDYAIPSITGDYLVNFVGQDFYGNKNTTESITFTVTSSSSSSSSSGSGPHISQVSGDCGSNCKSTANKLSSGDKIEFNLNGVEYTLFIYQVSKSKDYVIIEITSLGVQPIELTLNVGETLSLDVDRSGDNDITLNLESITNSLEAVINLESINKEGSPLKSPYISEEVSDSSALNTSIVIPIITVVGICVIIIFAIVFRNHQKNKRMFKRKDPHKRRRNLIILLLIVSISIVGTISYSKIVSSLAGQSADDSLIVEYNFTTDKLQDIVPFNVTFSSVYQSCSDSISEVKWDFDNDGDIDATGFNPTFEYNTSGNYTVNATIVTRNSGNFTRLLNITAYNALLTFTFDDSHISQINYGLPALTSMGVNATAFTVPEWVNSSKYEDDGFSQWTSYMSWDNISQLNASGWDMQGHGLGSGNYTECVRLGYGTTIANAKSNNQCNQLVIHPQLGQIGAINTTWLIRELNDSKQEMLDHGYNVTGIAYPGGNYSNISLTETENYYEWGRTVGGGVTGGQNNPLPWNLEYNYTIYTRPANDNVWNTTSYQTFLADAISNHTWMVWNFHIIDPSSCGDLCISISHVNQSVEYARNNSVKIVTMKEAMSNSWKQEQAR